MLQRPNNAQTYNTVASTWQRGPKVSIEIADYANAIDLPFDFLERSGHLTFAFVQELVQMLVEEPGQLLRQDGSPAIPTQAPSPGQKLAFAPVQANLSLFTWSPGPDGPDNDLAPLPGEPFHDVASLSLSAASEMQDELRDRVMLRDVSCVVTGTPFRRCQAAHLAPKHRDDIYLAALGEADYSPPPYSSAHAIFLETNLHREYDRFEWSFYVQEHCLIVHVFQGTHQLRPLHGKVIDLPGRFRISAEADIYLPDVRLMKWHYRQFVLMHLRGFQRKK